MKTKTSFFMAVVVGATITFNVSSLALADDAAVVSQVPENLVTAEALDAQIGAEVQAQADELQADAAQAAQMQDAESMNLEADRRGERREGGREYRPVPVPRPVYRPYPVRYPRPRPYPRPYPGVRLITCYAQSTINGVSYPGTAYSAAVAQNAALSTCLSATGAVCMATGCY